MKNTIKRLAALILTVALLLGCATVAFAQATTAPANYPNFICHICGTEFYNATTYDLHLVICKKLYSSAPLIYICSFCGQQYENKVSFVSHTTGCPMKDSEVALNPVGNICIYCGEVFHNEKEYNNHIQICYPTEICDKCGNDISSDYLDEHRKECESPVVEPASFIDRIIAFFKSIISFFTNLF